MRIVKHLVFVAILLCWVVPAYTLAAGDGGHEGSGDPVNVDLWQAAFTIAVFLILVFVLSRVAFKPILTGLKDREAFIRKSIHDAEEANKKAQEQLTQYTEQLNKARAEATAIVEEGRRDAEVVKKGIHEEARKEADAMIARAKREIGIARDSAVRDLYELGAKLATEVASKVIGREVNPADHERLIQESIADLEKVN